MPFDPDAFLAVPPAKAAPAPAGFDPDAFLGKKKSRSWKDVLADAPKAAFGEIGDAVKGAGDFVASLPEDPLGYKIGRAIKAAPGAIANQAGGMMQYVRNLSPENMRGSAPAFPGGEAENHPWMALAAGDTEPMKQHIAEKPLGLLADAVMAAGVTGPGRAMLGSGADLAMAGPRGLGRAIANMTPARRAETALMDAGQRSGSPDALVAALRGPGSNVPGVGLSAAQTAPVPELIQLERGSRINPRTSPAWANFDAGQNTGMFGALEGIVGPADDAAVQAARAARDAATAHGRQAATMIADQGSMEPFSNVPHTVARENIAAPIRETVARELESAHGAAAGAERTGDYVARNVGQGSEPAARTYEVRKTLSDALNSRAGLDLGDIKSSVKSADAMSRSIVSSIDRELDRASGGVWSDYLESYRANSPGVNSTVALNRIREDLADVVRNGATDLNGNPKLTRAKLGQIIERHATNDWGAVIEPGAQARLDALRDTAQRIEAPQANYRASATGGGSNTAHDLALTGASHFAHMIPGGRLVAALARGAGSLGEGAGATRLAEMLQNPAATSTALETAIQREAARRSRRSSGITPAALAAALAAQPQQ